MSDIIVSEFSLSEDIKVSDDFYNHVNKNWINENPIPDDKNRWGTFDQLREKNKNRMEKIFTNIIENNDKLTEKQSKEFSTVDAKEFELLENLHSSNKNINPINYSEELNTFVMTIFNSKDKDELKENLFNIFTLNGLQLPINFEVSPDLNDSDINILHVESSGLGLPDRDYYLSDKKKDIYEKYKIFMKKYLSLFMSISNDNIEKILLFEKKLAEASFTNLEKRNPSNMDNPTTYNNLIKNFKHLGLSNFNDFITEQKFFTGKKLKKINIINVKFLYKYEEIFENSSLTDLVHYFMWLFLLQVGSYLNENVIEEKFNFYGKIMGGAKKNTERSERVIEIESSLLGDILSKIYVEIYFSESSKKRALQLVKNVKSEFRKRLLNNNWMTENTREKALNKLDSMEVKIGYPDKFKDYSMLYDSIQKENSYLKNCLICKNFLFYDELKEIYLEKDKLKWFMNSFDINAYYSPQYNEIVFPAGILQKPFFSNEYPDSLNYGGIGVVIGHEITHGFDDQGRKFDKNGDLKNWYEEEDILNFKKLTDKLKNEFSNFTMMGINLNGELTLGENIADLGGVSISLDSLKKILKEEIDNESSTSSSYHDDYDDSIKEFFYNYARVWRINIRNEELKKRLQTDPHSPGLWRVNGILPNIEDFNRVFDINDGKLYKNTCDRINIW